MWPGWLAFTINAVLLVVGMALVGLTWRSATIRRAVLVTSPVPPLPEGLGRLMIDLLVGAAMAAALAQLARGLTDALSVSLLALSNTVNALTPGWTTSGSAPSPDFTGFFSVRPPADFVRHLVAQYPASFLIFLCLILLIQGVRIVRSRARGRARRAEVDHAE